MMLKRVIDTVTSKMPRLALGSIWIPIQCLLQSFSQVVKQAGNVADQRNL